MDEEERHQVNVRLPKKLKEEIQQLVDAGEYRDITSFVTEAIREKLDPNVYKARFARILIRILREDLEVRKEIFEIGKP